MVQTEQSDMPVHGQRIRNPSQRTPVQMPEKPASLPADSGDDSDLPFPFSGRDCSQKASLVAALAEHWDEGKTVLFQGRLSRHFQSPDPVAAAVCRKAEKEATEHPDRQDAIFCRALLFLNPDAHVLLWKGHRFMHLPALGRTLQECLDSGNTDLEPFMGALLGEDILHQCVAAWEPGNRELKKSAAALCRAFQAAQTDRDRQVVLYWTACTLSGQAVFSLDGERFRTVDDLRTYMQTLAGTHCRRLDDLTDFCHSLMVDDVHLHPALEGWLCALGCQKNLEKWQATMQNTMSS